jgi:hypothetical protein
MLFAAIAGDGLPRRQHTYSTNPSPMVFADGMEPYLPSAVTRGDLVVSGGLRPTVASRIRETEVGERRTARSQTSP